MGTPDFAAVILKKLVQWPGGEVVGVFTQPDRPCGRGQECRPSAVKNVALESGLEIFQPENFKGGANIDLIRDLNPDILVVAAYGLILPQALLDVPRFGAVNVHASLLPKYRGAAPIHRAIVDGESSTGITIMQMEAGLDTGPMLLQRALAIGINDTAETIHDQLADMGADLLLEALDKIRTGTARAIPQDDARATYAAKLTKDEGRVDWNLPAQEIHNRVRGLYPWPGSYFTLEGGKKPLRVGLEPGEIGPPLQRDVAPGTILGLKDEKVAIATADRVYYVPGFRPAHRKPCCAREFYCGYLSQGDDKVCT